MKNNPLHEHITEILELARLAPSVHNTQAQKVKLTEYGLEISVDQQFTLKDGDPTGRQNIISLGIFVEAIVIAAASKGFKLKNIVYSNEQVKLTIDKTIHRPADNGNIRALRQRATDRSVYRKTSISADTIKSILGAYKSPGIKIWLLDKEDQIAQIAQLTRNGIRLALTNPDFRKELSQYLREPWSKKKRGISLKSLYIPMLVAIFEPIAMRLGLGLNQEAKLEKRRWLSSSAIVLITAVGDMPDDWFEVGRAYMRVCLAIEKAGLSQATSAATVEASTFHEDVEQLLGTNQRLQAVIRIGAGSKKRQHSPRVDVATLLAT